MTESVNQKSEKSEEFFLTEDSESEWCSDCDFDTENAKITKSVNKLTESVNKLADSAKKNARFSCDCCNYHTNDQADYNKHLKTKKHSTRSSIDPEELELELESHKAHQCKCGKVYKYKESLSRHRRSCFYEPPSIPSASDAIAQFNSQFQTIMNVMSTFMAAQATTQTNQSVIMMEQNKTLMEIVKSSNETLANISTNALTTISNNNTNNALTTISNSNSHSNNKVKNITNNTQINDNKSFNLNLFLNETCKNAINLADFIDEIIVTLDDLERTGEIGYVGGISSLFIDRLNELDQEDRPMHCSDSKRATLFVRNNNKWEKEEIARQLLTKSIKQLALKSMKKIVEWQKLHPEYNDPESKQNDQYNRIMMNSMSGGTKEESESNYEKIFTNVVKNLVIDKKRIKYSAR